jgi:hypothetical protein
VRAFNFNFDFRFLSVYVQDTNLLIRNRVKTSKSRRKYLVFF